MTTKSTDPEIHAAVGKQIKTIILRKETPEVVSELHYNGAGEAKGSDAHYSPREFTVIVLSDDTQIIV